MELTNIDRRREMGDFLRSRRTRLAPVAAGLPAGERRRTPGLRRSEVAALAGISVDWYTWLEQGRDIQVSVQVLESVARALQLNENERRHLFLLALGQQPPETAPSSPVISETLQNVLDLLGTAPALVTDVRLNVVAWNKAAALVFGDYGSMPEKEKNTVWRTFTSPFIRELLQDYWEAHARRRLAQFRAGYGRFVGDPWWTELIAGLHEASAEFRAWWPRHDVLGAPEGRKLLHHPAAGELAFEHITFQVNDAPDLKVMVNTPLDDYGTADKMKRLLAEADEQTKCRPGH
ncbi:transcriptional regulator [Gordoniibacillus kamchatkensis]|uniref:Transcriptional regulator n=1 Tax=Gordoniibacillus kamchatkensis TaxID=1590651 RepID=A0ABR5AK88_9BACL|nr:helix-turn-helix transcriptional regulator [Paenibacillus sp. VKM B-2647]KIL40945.1 transcriptional regulator [Paenibacillus sp. VKM B-2647]